MFGSEVFTGLMPFYSVKTARSSLSPRCNDYLYILYAIVPLKALLLNIWTS